MIAPPGARTLVSGDGVNFTFADDSRTAAFDTQLGSPQGQVAGVAGTANRSVTNVEWDATNRVQYVATLTGNAATTVWTPAYSNVFTPQGYLTPVSGTPIITGDSLSATTIYYTPYNGNWTFLSNGTTVYPYQFPEISYALTNTLLANNIYDVFIYNSSGSVDRYWAVLGGRLWRFCHTRGLCAGNRRRWYGTRSAQGRLDKCVTHSDL